MQHIEQCDFIKLWNVDHIYSTYLKLYWTHWDHPWSSALSSPHHFHSSSTFQPTVTFTEPTLWPVSSRGHHPVRHPSLITNYPAPSRSPALSPVPLLSRRRPVRLTRQRSREALPGHSEVEVPWRTRLPGWLSDEQGSVKGSDRSFPQTNTALMQHCSSQEYIYCFHFTFFLWLSHII